MRTTATRLAAAVTAGLLVACGGGGGESDEVATGMQVYNQTCVVCHGPNGTGTDQGPPLVHIVYEPSHHSDDAFRTAVTQGVAPHHWDFGPMPAIPSVDDEEIDAVIAYVRSLQEAEGIR